MEDTYFPSGYLIERQAIITANSGSGWISVVSLLPRAPDGVWASVSHTLGSFESPERFLVYLFGELTVPPRAGTHSPKPRIVLDGFLGSAGSAQSPSLLLPVAGVWAGSPASVQRNLRHLRESVAAWSGGQSHEMSPMHFPNPDDLKAFVPYARTPNRKLVERFLAEAKRILVPKPA